MAIASNDIWGAVLSAGQTSRIKWKVVKNNKDSGRDKNQDDDRDADATQHILQHSQSSSNSFFSLEKEFKGLKPLELSASNSYYFVQIAYRLFGATSP